MGDNGQYSLVEHGVVALKKAIALEEAENIEEAVDSFKDAVECFTTALREPGIKIETRKTLLENIKHYKKKIQDMELASSLEKKMPSVPMSRPVSKSEAAQDPEKAETRARGLLSAAMDLHVKGKEVNWNEPPDEERVCIAYMDAAEALKSAVKLLRNASPAATASAYSDRAKVLEELTTQTLDTASDLLSQKTAKAGGRASAAASAKPRAPPSKSPIGYPRSPVPYRKPTAPPKSPIPPPLDKGGLHPDEMAVLGDSSSVNGKVYMPWLEEDLEEKFDYPRPWVDEDGLLPLAEKQQKHLTGWKRPSQFMRGKPTMIASVTPYSIKQDLISDCSFVASLCIASAFEQRFHKQLITSIIYPQDKRRVPKYNPAGKYMVKLWINGIARKVMVDDLLPTGENGRLLCSASTDKRELWVSIIEKAYLKVNGGYNFPGSNSGIDLFALTGWLPEQIFFEEHRKKSSNSSGSKRSMRDQPLDSYQPAERVWQRLLAHKFGDCLITVATGEIAEDEAEAKGLVPSHAYAVLDVREVGGVRLLQVKNPWSRKRWRGPYSVEDTQRWTAEMKRALNYDLESAALNDNGVFWIDYPSICKYFSNVFMNWNPSLFSYRTVLHACWPAAIGPKNDSYNLGYNPQLSLIVKCFPTTKSERKGEVGQGGGGGVTPNAPSKASPIVWVLLSRHVTEVEGDETAGDYLTMHVYDCEGSNGKRVHYPDVPMYRGIYTNNPHTLVRFDLPVISSTEDKDVKVNGKGSNKDERAYTLVISQHEKKRDVRYTVNVYCTSSFKLFSTPEPPPHKKTVHGAWDADSAGGAVGLPRFFKNPQYALVLNQATKRVHLQLEAPRDYPVNISVLEEGGRRVDTIIQEKEVLTSGAYRQGFCYIEGYLQAGRYTVVVSTFKAHQLGGFVLKVSTSNPVQQFSPIPPEGDGMTKQVIQGDWREEDGSAAGCSNYSRYLANPRYVLTFSRRTSILLRLALPDNAGPFQGDRPALNVSLFAASTAPSQGGWGLGSSASGGLGRVGVKDLDPRCKPTSSLALATSNGGVYTDCLCGAATGRVDLDAGSYVVVVSTFHPLAASFLLSIYCDPPVDELYQLE